MISVIIPVRNAAAGLADCLASLSQGRDSGLIGEIVVVDGGSTDATAQIAEAGADRLLQAPPGRARQMRAGAVQAAGDWLLFLHGDVVLEAGWEAEVQAFLALQGKDATVAAAFGFALRDDTPKARLLERLVAWRCRWLGLAYGDQGLLLPRKFYENLGGFAMLEFMEDVEIIRRIGRRRLALLNSRAASDAARYRNDGFLARCSRNAVLTSLYLLGVPAARLAGFYASKAGKRRKATP